MPSVRAVPVDDGAGTIRFGEHPRDVAHVSQESGPALRRGGKSLVPAATLMAIGLLAGCTSAPTVDAALVAAEVASTVEQQIDVRPAVDCGAGPLSIADGAAVDCTITDPSSDRTYDARVDIINPGGDDQFTVNLSVANDSNP